MLPVLVPPSSLQNDFIIGLLGIQGKKTITFHSSFVHNRMRLSGDKVMLVINCIFLKSTLLPSNIHKSKLVKTHALLLLSSLLLPFFLEEKNSKNAFRCPAI